MRRRIFPAVVVAALPFFVGCGGGGGGSTAVAITTPLKVDLSWAARSRVISSPASARSAVIFLQQGAALDGGSVQFPAIDRQDSPAAYTQSYVSPQYVRPGPNLISVVFYADKAGAGAVVGVASKAINIANDGTGTGDILTVGKVQTVSVVAPSVRTLGQTGELSVSAVDGNGAPVAVSSGSASFTVESGGDVLEVTADGKYTAKAVGVAKLHANLDGKTSATVTVTVVPTGAITVTLPALQNLAVAETKPLQVSVKDGVGADVPLGTGGIQFTLVRGSDALSVTGAGSATGAALGYGVVRATVAGTASAPQAVFVGPIVTTGTGLKYIEKTVGSGAAPVVGKNVTVNYTGSLLDGTIFDSSLNPGRTPFTFPAGVGYVVPGFDEGVMGMKVGGKRLLIIPSDLGYGARGQGSTIPPNSTLIFDLELLSVES